MITLRKKTSEIMLFAIAISILQSCGNNSQEQSSEGKPQINKVKDIIIYEDPLFYASFSSVVKRPDGELLVAFRRAPNRRNFGETSYTHVDPNSYLVMVRSRNGENWSKEPELIYAHPFGGSQDPCLLQLRDGTLLCASYGWAIMKPESFEKFNDPVSWQKLATFLGGYIVRSTDGGKNWEGPVYPTSVPSETRRNILGYTMPAYNRGAMCEGKSGRIYWAVAAPNPSRGFGVYLMTSDDKGMTWNYNCPVATDSVASFNETSVYETPKGDIVAFLRTANFNDQACIARSTDGGKSFKWESMDFQGHPLNALRLPDNRVLLTYGYRHEPYGIRARILNAECTDFAASEEFILRDDGGGFDIGYTWPVQLDGNKVLVVYYFNKNDGIRYISGTIIEIK